MKNNKKLICFMGLKHCGKGYNAQPYIKLGFKKISLADPLREVAWNILGFNPEKNNDISYDNFKNCNLLAEIEHNFMGLISYHTGIKITSGRKILQNIGTEFKRLFGTDYWCNLWYDSVVNSGENVVCDDIRFPNEINTVLKLKDADYDVSFVWCQYEGADYKNILKDCHESEMLNQFIYCNRLKYGLHDGSIIDEKTMKAILEDFSKRIG